MRRDYKQQKTRVVVVVVGVTLKGGFKEMSQVYHTVTLSKIEKIIAKIRAIDIRVIDIKTLRPHNFLTIL